MYNIKYITINNEDYTNKQKVYFSCHPDDFGPYLDLLVNDIMRHSDCAVFYDETPDAPYNEYDYKNLLLSASLMVVPVTKNFLSRPNRSRELDIKFAAENFIPVLPVMMQEGLVQSFNAIVGDMQFLDRTAKDDTAVSYDEKLRNYIDSVLVDNEMLQQIQNAFDARIFLSYRKKNRASANKLMRLIHRQDFCRDIAIWYDEMLVAGEDFNKSIKSAIEKCDIFAVAVTPKMLEKDNYVLAEELPFAKALGKEIFAVKVQPTDDAAIAETFGDIPVVDSYDEQQFAQSLLQLVKKIGIRQQNSSPQHRYFIGFAYLYGIDVERNTAKALELIKDAAEDGHKRAKEKLANMYLSGDGVPRDLNNAVVWIDSLIDQLEEEHEQNPTEAAAADIVQLMCDVCGILDRLMRCEDILGRAEDIEYYCGEYKANAENSIFWRQMESIACYYFGKACRALGQIDLAVQYYSKVTPMITSLRDDTGNEAYSRLIIDSTKALFEIYRDIAAFGPAEKSVNYYHKMCLAMSMDVNSHKDKINLIDSHRAMGDWYSHKGDKAVAQQHLSTAFALAQQLYEDYSGEENLLAFAGVCDSFGQFYALNGNHPKAAEMLKKAVVLLNDIILKADIPYIQMQRALSYYHLAATEYGSSNTRLARKALEKAISIVAKMYEDNPLHTIRAQLLQLFCSMSRLCYDGFDYKDAAIYCNKAIDMLVSEAESGNGMLQNIYGFDVYFIAGHLHQINKNNAAASVCYNNAIALSGHTVKKIEFYKTYESFFDFSLQLIRICQFLLFNDECQTALEQLDLLVRLNGIVENKPDGYTTTEFWNNLAKMYSFCDEYRKALTCLKKILPYYEQKLKSEYSLGSVNMCMTYFGWMCQLCTLLGRTGEAERYKETAEKVYKLYKRDFAHKDEFYTEYGVDPASHIYSYAETIKKNFKRGFFIG